MKYEKYISVDEMRPMNRISGERNYAMFVQTMQSHNYNEIHHDSGEDCSDKFIAAIHINITKVWKLAQSTKIRIVSMKQITMLALLRKGL